MDEIEVRTIRKVMWRLLPFLFVCYFVAYLDRVNVGFAKLQMNSALGLSEAAYGFGAGLFFISYFLFEVPSNLALDRFGARLWIARIMSGDFQDEIECLGIEASPSFVREPEGNGVAERFIRTSHGEVQVKGSY